MYSWIWRKLPFGLAGKLTGSVLLAAATLALLWYVVFPWAEPVLTPFDDVQVTQTDAPDGDPGITRPTPTEDGHELPYDTDQNNSAPPSPDR